jgi:hypothetical protein
MAAAWSYVVSDSGVIIDQYSFLFALISAIVDVMGGLRLDRASIERMQAGMRTWILRAAGGSARGLRGIPPPVLLSLLCASAFSPLFAVVTGLGAAGVAGSAVLSSVGGGALSGIIAGAGPGAFQG